MDFITHYEFKSNLFPPDGGEEKVINPGCYGRKLTEFISTGLRGQNYQIGKAIAEDWGWVVPVLNRGFTLWIGCGKSAESDNSFLCFINPKRPELFHIFKKRHVIVEINKLSDALKLVLTNDAVNKLRGITYAQCMAGT